MNEEELQTLQEAEEASADVVAPEEYAVTDSPVASTPGAARLIVKRSGAETTDEFAIHSPAIVGRFDPTVGPIDVDLGPLPEGVYVSRRHAKIHFEDGTWKVQDLGSSNGTFVLRGDFERVEEAEIGDGTEIAFGNARFVFKCDATAPEEAEAAEPMGEDEPVAVAEEG
jgi:pSer/pThr/pTyr-binding forkhead associated (FHA) protein